MDARLSLESSWVGEGAVTSVLGRTLRTFVVNYQGAWSEDYQAFHVHEKVSYADGRSLRRNWAIMLDEDQNWSGTNDAGRRMILRGNRETLVICGEGLFRKVVAA